MVRFTQKQHFFAWFCFMSVTVITGVIGIHVMEGTAQTAWMLGILNLMLVFTQITLVFLFRKALLTHFYSFASVALLGGILFEGFFILSVLGYFISAIGNPEMLTREYMSEIFLMFPRRFSYGAIVTIAVMSVAVSVSNIALMRHEGYRGKNALGVLLGIIYIGGTAFLYWLTSFLRSKFESNGVEFNSYAAAGVYVFIALTLLVTLCYFECLFIGFALMSLLSVRRVPKHDKDFVIIPGCQIRSDGTPTPLLKGRVDRAVRFVGEQQSKGVAAPKLIPSGGKGRDEVISEAESMATYIKGLGIPAENVLPEGQSFTTEQNMRYSKAIAETNAKTKDSLKYAFSTTNYHVFRAGIFATEADMNAEGMASETKWYFWPNGAIREFFAILALNKAAHIKALAIIAAVCAGIGVAVIFGYIG